MAISFKRTLTKQMRIKIPVWYWKLHGFEDGDEVEVLVTKVGDHPVDEQNGVTNHVRGVTADDQ